MSEIDQKAEHLIKSYKTTEHEDYTRTILLALFTHAPTPEGKAYIRGEVLKNEGDAAGMKHVADSILRKLLLPDTPETVEWNPGDQWLPTYASHVIPLSATTKSGSWQSLERFAGFRLDELQGHKISSIQNIITLSYDIHVAFCRFLVWFELDRKNPKPNVYRFRKQLPSLPGPPDGTIVRLKSTDPDLPLPPVKYILLHAALAKVLRDSDMGRWVDGTLRELERLESLASDGSHADVLASSLHATGLESGAWDQFGKDYPFLDIQEILKSSHGVRSIETLRRWLRLDSEEKLEAEVVRFESEVIRHGLVLLPGVQQILDKLNEGSTEETPGWTIVTSATRWYAPRALKSVNIPLPKHIVMAEDVEHGKPHPDPYLQGAKNCHVDPQNCLVVEDALAGMKAGRAAGAKVLGVCTSAPRESVEKGEPDYIVQDLTKSSPYDLSSPSFQLCLSGTQECGEAVWPHVKRLANGTYSITMAIPDLGGDNNFFIRMEDDDGDISDTPMFKLQGSSEQSDQASSPNSSSSGQSRSGTNASQGGEGGKSDKDDKNGINSKGTSGARASGPPVSSTSASNSSSLSAAAESATMSLLPSTTNRALVAASENNKPSTVAIVVPLAIFAAALAGLIFSLRQRSKARKEIECRDGRSKDDPSLHRAISEGSSSTASQSSASSSGKTDLERAMEFISGIQVQKSPTLTPLPPSIESMRRARMQNRLERDNALQADRAMATGIPTTELDISQTALRPAVVQHPGSYATYPSYGSGLQYAPLYRLPTIPQAVPLIDPSTYATLVPGNGFRSEIPHTMVNMPPGLKPRRNPLDVEVLDQPTVVQPQASGYSSHSAEQHRQLLAPAAVIANQEAFPQIPVGSSQPVEYAPVAPAPIHASASTSTIVPPLPLEPLPPPPVLPASLRVAQPQARLSLEHAGNHSHTEVAQPRSYESATPTAGPDIPYATRPSTSSTTLSSTLSGLPNPYAAIEMALRAGS
ncbi:hypothetical protein FRC07_003420 [Ceratobasidium sp. 392]|nr:hypothetical protein FRC07_003420 [Ceratobasidium sp. 392]